MSERAAALLHHFLRRSIDRAGRGRDRKFKPLVLGEIQAAGDIAAVWCGCVRDFATAGAATRAARADVGH
jgi:hypothetical protein